MGEIIHSEKRNFDGKLRIYLTLRCNMRCPYCANNYNKLDALSMIHSERSSGEWANAINRIGRDIIITGGEPTLYKGLYALIAKLDSKIGVTIYSNGSFDADTFNARIGRKINLLLSYHSGDYDKFAYVVETVKRNHTVHVTTLNPLAQEKLEKRGVKVEVVGHQEDKYSKHFKDEENVYCYKENYLISPNGTRYPCVSKMMRQKDPMENIIDSEFDPSFQRRFCADYGICSPCDFLGTTIIERCEIAPEIVPERTCDGVSVITTAYKSHPYIRAYLDSVESQVYWGESGNYEILLGIDHCPEVLEEVNRIRDRYKNLRVFYFDKNYGTYIVKNSLAYIAKYNYLLFFDSDDMMFPNLVKKHYRVMKDFDVVGQTKTMFSCDNNLLPKDNEWVQAQCGRGWGGNWGIWKESFMRMGGFMPWVCKADNEFTDRAKNSRLKMYFYQEPLFFRRVHGNALTRHPDTCMGSRLRNELDKIRLNRKDKKIVEPVVPVFGEFTEI